MDMRLLALETSGAAGSIAAFAGGNLLHLLHLDSSRRSAQTLAPGCRQLLQKIGWQPRDVQLVAVTIGPGSFTGLRIGVTTAKTFAYATGAQVLGINTLEAIAQHAPNEWQVISAIIDAQRQELFVGEFERVGNGRLALRSDVRLVSIDAWLNSLAPGAHVAGPALAKVRHRLPEHVITSGDAATSLNAEDIGRVAWRYYQEGRRDALWQLAPLYLRQSAAEEKLAVARSGIQAR